MRVRLCRKSLRDLTYWRSLARGEGRDLVHRGPGLTLYSDSRDFSYGGTLGKDEEAGARGLWEGQGFWTAVDRAQSITFRKLLAVRLLLHRHFSAFVSDPHVRKVLLQEDNQAVVYVINSIVSASRPMMAEVLLRVLGVRIDARWIPSAVNRYADSLSRTWDPGDVRVTAWLAASIQEERGIDEMAFATRQME